MNFFFDLLVMVFIRCEVTKGVGKYFFTTASKKMRATLKAHVIKPISALCSFLDPTAANLSLIFKRTFWRQEF